MQQFSKHVEQSSWTFLGGGTAVFAVMVLGAMITALPSDVYAAAAFKAQAPANSYVQPDRRVGRVINLNQAIRIAQEKSGGKVLGEVCARQRVVSAPCSDVGRRTAGYYLGGRSTRTPAAGALACEYSSSRTRQVLGSNCAST